MQKAQKQKLTKMPELLYVQLMMTVAYTPAQTTAQCAEVRLPPVLWIYAVSTTPRAVVHQTSSEELLKQISQTHLMHSGSAASTSSLAMAE